MKHLADSWNEAWSQLQLDPPAHLIRQIVSAYNEPHRAYHTLQHLEECIAHFAATTDLAQHPGEVGIAVWFHDAIYDLKGKDNELRSAEWAVQALQESGADVDTQQRVFDLIMATCHRAVPSDPDQQLLVDIDLAILGSSPERFREYDRQVRAEYNWVPGFLYAIKRKEVLRGFLAREFIYSTDFFRASHEQQARANLLEATS